MTKGAREPAGAMLPGPVGRVYSCGEAGHALHRSPQRIRQLAVAGKLRAWRTGVGWLVDADAVDELAAGRSRERGQAAGTGEEE